MELLWHWFSDIEAYNSLRDLEAAWESVLRVEVTDIELETNPELMKVAQPDDRVILLGFEVKATLFTGMITLCYPLSVIQLV